MKSLNILAIFLLFLLVGTACKGETTPEPTTVSPTEAPTAAPTKNPTPLPTLSPTATPTVAADEIPVLELAPSAAITNIIWQWAEWTQIDPAAQALIPDPEQYAITFFSDGTLLVKADCNNGSGTYTADGMQMSITLNEMTSQACSETSQADTFLALLGQVNAFGMQDDKLALLLAENKGQIALVNGGEIDTAPPAADESACNPGIDPANVFVDTFKDAFGLPDDTFINCVAGTPYKQDDATGVAGLPDHIEINFNNPDPAAKTYRDPVIYIIPIADYIALWEQNNDLSVSETYTQVVQLLRVRPAPIPTADMPVLPFEQVHGTNDLASQYAYVDTDFGFGVRFVGRFAETPLPVSNDTPQMFYIFQGLSDDGAFYVSFFYPVRTDELPDSDAISDAERQQAGSDPAAYLEDKIADLNALSDTDWQPSLAALDATIASLKFPPPIQGPGLTDALWAWNELILPDGASLIQDADAYTLRFLPDNTVYITADCNTGLGEYTLDGNALTIQVGRLTRVVCGENSLSDQFLDYLSRVDSYELLPAYLGLDLAEDAGRLGFYIGSPIPENPDLPADAPIAEARETINVRSGPGTDYPSYGLANPGDRALIVGVSADGGWWVIDLPDYIAPDGRGWVSADYVTVSNAEGVPIVEPPPLP